MDTQLLKLDSNLDIKVASPLVDSLLPLRGVDLSVDASDVKQLGSQCLQILLSAKKTWEADGNFFTLTTASEAFFEGLEHLGFPRDHFSAQITDDAKEISK